jgi:hypothetical protein
MGDESLQVVATSDVNVTVFLSFEREDEELREDFDGDDGSTAANDAEAAEGETEEKCDGTFTVELC